MIDIHSHILPGVDDGSQSLDESLAMAKMAWNSGVSVIVATPHANVPWSYKNYDSPVFRKKIWDLQYHLRQHECDIKIVTGMEIFATEDVDDKIAKGALIPINKSRYYLVEFPFDVDPFWMEERLYSILCMDKIPVIAHPERYDCIQDEPAVLYHFMSMGCLSQINKGSIFGRFGRKEQRTAQILLDHHLVTCFASDAHGPYVRTTFLGDIRDFLLDMYGEERMYRLLYENPGKIIGDEPIYHRHMTRPDRGGRR